MRKKLIIFVMVSLSLLLCGCELPQIFVNENDKYKLVATDDESLINDVYYVKDKAQFFKCYKPNGTASGKASKPKSGRIFWISKDASLIPSYYKGELIAYQSNEMDMDSITLERFSNVGYSFGMYNGKMDENNTILYDKKNNVVKDTSAYKVLDKLGSDDIRIFSIDGKTVDKKTIDRSGVIPRLEADKTYKVELYEGTKFCTVEMVADLCYLESFEVFSIDKISTTKNGYLCIQLPDDFKSGYYYINGFGLFKYYDFAKGESNTANTDMNEPYYKSDTERLNAYSQLYTIVINKKTRNVEFDISYSIDYIDEIEDEDIAAVLTSPDGTTYDFEKKDLKLKLELDDAMAGDWKVNVMPKELNIIEVSANETTPAEDALSDVYTFTIDKEQQNLMFKATYTGTWINAPKDERNVGIWGIVENEDKEAVDMNVDSKGKTLTAVYPYLKPGTYTVTIYHYYGINIGDVTYGQDDTQYEEIILDNTEITEEESEEEIESVDVIIEE